MKNRMFEVSQEQKLATIQANFASMPTEDKEAVRNQVRQMCEEIANLAERIINFTDALESTKYAKREPDCVDVFHILLNELKRHMIVGLITGSSPVASGKMLNSMVCLCEECAAGLQELRLAEPQLDHALFTDILNMKSRSKEFALRFITPHN